MTENTKKPLKLTSFLVDSSFSADPRFQALVSTEGAIGVAVYFVLLAAIAREGGRLEQSTAVFVGCQFKLSIEQTEQLLEAMIAFDLLFEDNGFLGSTSLDRDVANVQVKRSKWNERQRVSRSVTRDTSESHASTAVTLNNEPEPEPETELDLSDQPQKLQSSTDGGAGGILPVVIEPPKSPVPKNHHGFRQGASALGEFGRVWLRPGEREALEAEFDAETVAEKIASLDAELENGVAKYRKYKNHKATLANWCRMGRSRARAGPIRPWTASDNARDALQYLKTSEKTEKQRGIDGKNEYQKLLDAMCGIQKNAES